MISIVAVNDFTGKCGQKVELFCLSLYPAALGLPFLLPEFTCYFRADEPIRMSIQQQAKTKK
jgi:hypothetical protein